MSGQVAPLDDDVKSFRDLHVWQEGIRLVTTCYRATKSFPSEERFGLVNQMRRAAVSIPANIAEGWARDSTREYLRFVAIAAGSLAELETHVEIAVALDFLSAEACESLHKDMDRLGRRLNRLQQSLRKKL